MFSICAAAQESSKPCHNSGWSLEVRQNTNTQTDVARPAFITVTRPEGGPSHVQAAVAVMANCDVREGLTIAPYVDYHRNDATTRKQNVGRTGSELEWITNPIDMADTARGSRQHSGVLLAAVDVERDAVEQTRSVNATARYTYFFTGGGVWRPNQPFRLFGDKLELLYGPYAGFEHEQVVEAQGDGTGSIGRFWTELLFFAYPAPRTLRGRLEFAIASSFRRDLWGVAADADRSHPLFEFDGTGYFLRTEHVAAGIGISFKTGESPNDDFERQSYWQFSVKLRMQ